MSKLLPALWIWLAINCSPSFAETSIHHDTFQASDTKKKVEYFWAKPEGEGPWPVLFLIHPHQEWPNKIGAQAFVKNQTLEKWTKKGWITVAISQPGYGESEGPADFCGPHTQQAVSDLIQHFRTQPIVKSDSIVLYGGSRGAVVASMLATRDQKLAGVILRSGLYNLAEAYASYPWYSLLKWAMIWELGFPSSADLQLRSAYFEAQKIRAPLLIFHGTSDDRAAIKYTNVFAEKVRQSGGQVDLFEFESEHIIPQEKIAAQMEAFLEKIARK